MDRLTSRNKEGQVLSITEDFWESLDQDQLIDHAHNLQQAMDKLCEYEETDLTPSRIEEIKHMAFIYHSKNTPVPTTMTTGNGRYCDDDDDTFCCPKCNAQVGYNHFEDCYCFKCGQKLTHPEDY